MQSMIKSLSSGGVAVIGDAEKVLQRVILQGGVSVHVKERILKERLTAETLHHEDFWNYSWDKSFNMTKKKQVRYKFSLFVRKWEQSLKEQKGWLMSFLAETITIPFKEREKKVHLWLS